MSDADYKKVGAFAVDTIEKLCEANVAATWPSLDLESDGIKVYSRQATEFPEAQEKMLFVLTTVNASATKALKLMAPFDKFRQQWDDLLEKQLLLSDLGDETFLTHTFVKKKLILAARDAIDVTKVKRRPDGVLVFGTKGIDHSGYPEQKNYVRTKQFLSGAYFKPLTDSTCEARIVFCADLNLPVPKLMASMVASFKPKLLAETVQGLKKAAVNKKYNV